MAQAVIYHNPRCSKSRETLALLRAQGIEPQVVEYLKDIPSKGQIKALIKALGLKGARDLMRTKEHEYTALGLADESLSQDALIGGDGRQSHSY